MYLSKNNKTTQSAKRNSKPIQTPQLKPQYWGVSFGSMSPMKGLLNLSTHVTNDNK